MSARHVLLDSPTLGRRVHLWCFGEMGQPVVVFPSNAGVAHEWKESGMVEALAPLLRAARLKLYCTESTVSRTFSGEGPVDARMYQHHLYERFVTETLADFIRKDCRQPRVRLVATGCSMGALYATLFSLKFPRLFRAALCMSGRYRGASFAGRGSAGALYFNDPLAFVPNLSGPVLDDIRAHTHLTLVVGQGPFENSCLPETVELARWLGTKRIPHHLGLWGTDSRHDYTWWRKQALHYLAQLV